MKSYKIKDRPQAGMTYKTWSAWPPDRQHNTLGKRWLDVGPAGQHQTSACPASYASRTNSARYERSDQPCGGSVVPCHACRDYGPSNGIMLREHRQCGSRGRGGGWWARIRDWGASGTVPRVDNPSTRISVWSAQSVAEVTRWPAGRISGRGRLSGRLLSGCEWWALTMDTDLSLLLLVKWLHPTQPMHTCTPWRVETAQLDVGPTCSTADTITSPNVGILLGQRHSRWSILEQHIVSMSCDIMWYVI